MGAGVTSASAAAHAPLFTFVGRLGSRSGAQVKSLYISMDVRALGRSLEMGTLAVCGASCGECVRVQGAGDVRGYHLRTLYVGVVNQATEGQQLAFL